MFFLSLQRNIKGETHRNNCFIDMTKDTYLELGKTAEGRAKAHDLMVDEIREKMDDLALSVAPTKQAKVKALFDKAFEVVKGFGNSLLFEYFASSLLKPSEFVKNVNSVNRGGFVNL